MRGGNDYRPAVGSEPPIDAQNPCERSVDLARRQHHAPRQLFAEVFGGLLQDPCVDGMQKLALEPLPHLRQRSSRDIGRSHFLEGPRARQHVELAIDDPDARRRPGKALDNLRYLGRARRRRCFTIGGRGHECLGTRALRCQRITCVGFDVEESWAIVQCGGHRLRGSGKRALLRVAQKALQFLNVLVTQPGNRQKHRQHQQQLRPDAERNPEMDFHVRNRRRGVTSSSERAKARSETQDSTDEVRRGASEDTTKRSGRAVAYPPVSGLQR